VDFSQGQRPTREGVSGLARLSRCLVTWGGLRRGGRLIRRGMDGGRSVRGGTGGSVGVGSGGVGGGGKAAGGSACCYVVPGLWR